MGLFSKVTTKLKQHLHSSDHDHQEESSAPPAWAPAPEISHAWGKWNEAPEEEYQAGERFCQEYSPTAPRLLPSAAVEYMSSVGCKAWGIEHPATPRFSGKVENPGETKGTIALSRVTTDSHTKDTCLLSTLPLLAGLYDIQGKTGIYYEVAIRRMDGFLAIGTACRPYPAWRLPGWNRLSAGWHLDDLRKFFEDPDGGRDYVDSSLVSHIKAGDTVGCGYEFATGSLFYTYNGIRLPHAFSGIYLPRHEHDVFAAIGVEGACDFEVNFGGDIFRWREGNEWAWRVEGHVGKIVGSSHDFDPELPAYVA